MGYKSFHYTAVRYKGFLLIEQYNQSWLVRPERSPMTILPFRTPICPLAKVKELLDLRLSNLDGAIEAA